MFALATRFGFQPGGSSLLPVMKKMHLSNNWNLSFALSRYLGFEPIRGPEATRFEKFELPRSPDLNGLRKEKQETIKNKFV